MTSRYLDHTPHLATSKAVRRDIPRAALMVCCLTAALMPALFFVTRGEQIAPDGEYGFGRQTRVGAIIFTPFVGDVCRQSAFDNDSGAIWPMYESSCLEIFGRLDPRAKDGSALSNFAIISEKFRR